MADLTKEGSKFAELWAGRKDTTQGAWEQLKASVNSALGAAGAEILHTLAVKENIQALTQLVTSVVTFATAINDIIAVGESLRAAFELLAFAAKNSAMPLKLLTGSVQSIGGTAKDLGIPLTPYSAGKTIGGFLGNLLGLGGGSAGANATSIDNPPELAAGKGAQNMAFVGLTQLAEKMQMEASRQLQEDNLKANERTADATEKLAEAAGRQQGHGPSFVQWMIGNIAWQE